MSHIVTIATKVHDPIAIRAACQLSDEAPERSDAYDALPAAHLLMRNAFAGHLPIVLPHRAIASNLTVNYSLWMLTWTRGKRKMVRNVARAPEVRDVADRSQGTFYTAL